MKLFGCILIILSCTLFGFFKSLSLSKRCKSLLEIKSVLMSLKTEISFLKKDLAESLKSASKGYSVYTLFYTCANNLKTLGIDKAWDDALAKNCYTLCFSEEDKNILKNLSKELGKTDTKNQLQHIDFILELISESYIKAETEYRQKSSIYKSAGISIGVFTVLLLI